MAETTEKLVIKNCYAEPWKQAYADLRLGNKQTESTGMACGHIYIAAPWDVGGGGMIGLIRIADCGRNPPVTKIKGHTGPIQDLAFSPFHESLLATGSEDTTVRIWDASENLDPGQEIKDSLCVLTGALKKIVATEWNPAASHILVSGSFDGTTTVWDVQRAASHYQVKLSDAILSLKWNMVGDKIAATTKDKLLHIMDPRSGKILGSVTCHEGSKACKCCWVDGFAGSPDNLLTTGFSKANEREIAVWDVRNLDKPISRLEVDRGSQPLYPTFDETLGVAYIGGKGDGNLRYYQVSNGDLRKIDEYRSNIPTKTFCFLPKLLVDQMRTEVGRMFKNENNNSILPISFIVPRKNTDVFQADLYPPTVGVNAAADAETWLSGKSGVLRRVSVKPGDTIAFSSTTTVPQSQKSAETRRDRGGSGEILPTVNTHSERGTEALLEEIKALKQRVKELEPLEKVVKGQASRISELSETRQKQENTTKVEKIADLEAENKEIRAELSGLKSQLEDCSSRLVTILKKLKEKEEEANQLREKLEATEKQISNLNKAGMLISSHVSRAEGRINRLETKEGVDEQVRKEFDEMRNFFREILDNTAGEMDSRGQ